MQSRIVILDYGMGNLRSVVKKFERLKIQAMISSDIEDIRSADKIILPGVGHFANGMKNLRNFGLLDLLNEKVLVNKIPILGICLGVQLFCNYSEEGHCKGLGWIDADVVKFKVSDTLKFKIPHIGWNSAEVLKESKLFKGIIPNDLFYFVHSYHLVCHNNNDILTTTKYDSVFTSSIEKENILGTQFHPEKSHDAGEILLKNFAEL